MSQPNPPGRRGEGGREDRVRVMGYRLQKGKTGCRRRCEGRTAKRPRKGRWCGNLKTTRAIEQKARFVEVAGSRQGKKNRHKKKKRGFGRGEKPQAWRPENWGGSKRSKR